MATEKEIDELTAEIHAARTRWHELIDDLSGSEQRQLNELINSKQRLRESLIREGCGPCHKCGSAPIGRIQKLHVGGVGTLDGYGVICSRPACRVRSTHLTIEKARELWNESPLGMDEPDTGGSVLTVSQEPMLD